MSYQFKGRREDLRLVTGGGQYTADWNLPGQVFGYFLRSDRAHAEIVSLDADAARAVPGVLGIFTGEDALAAGFKTPSPMMVTGKAGVPLRVPQRPMLASGRVRFVGELVALVVAETEPAARDAAESIVLEYRDRPVVVDAEDTVRPGAALLHDDAPGNLAVETEYGDAVGVGEAFAKADHVVRVAI
jgi:carbon-monoxide dehydrogenase large subunit